jgi:hypothetical protein
MRGEGSYLDCLRGFVHYGSASSDSGEVKWGSVRKLHGVVYYGGDKQHVFEVLVDLKGKKRWARSVNGGPFAGSGGGKRYKRFYGVLPASASELEAINSEESFRMLLGPESKAALKKLDFQDGFGEVLF